MQIWWEKFRPTRPPRLGFDYLIPALPPFAAAAFLKHMDSGAAAQDFDRLIPESTLLSIWLTVTFFAAGQSFSAATTPEAGLSEVLRGDVSRKYVTAYVARRLIPYVSVSMGAFYAMNAHDKADIAVKSLMVVAAYILLCWFDFRFVQSPTMDIAAFGQTVLDRYKNATGIRKQFTKLTGTVVPVPCGVRMRIAAWCLHMALPLVLLTATAIAHTVAPGPVSYVLRVTTFGVLFVTPFQLVVVYRVTFVVAGIARANHGAIAAMWALISLVYAMTLWAASGNVLLTVGALAVGTGVTVALALHNRSASRRCEVGRLSLLAMYWHLAQSRAVDHLPMTRTDG
ncbi:hypothetical protein [uncultured Williamsia sp.]|uniref:hypothetical protein n=1 Tax=uncultured Williamsia sp. TaxID=259311 RepID=UPI002608E306|nr:hypothetical protein [uncultured Williamsia sp.]